MKRILKNRLTIPFVFSGLLLVTIFFNRSYTNESMDLKKLMAGLQTCTNRTNQTFTATMIGETSSGFVGEEFTNLTDECLSELNSLANNSVLVSSDFKDSISELTEKTHWFHQKVLKIVETLVKGTEEINTFDIASRFEVLDMLRSNITVSLESLETSNNDSLATSSALTIFLALVALFSLGYSLLMNARDDLKTQELENTANEIITNSNMLVATADKIFMDYFSLADLPTLKGLFARYSEEIFSMTKSKTHDNTRAKRVKEEIKKQRENFDLSQVLESGVESLQKQAFKHKVRVDANWNDRLFVMGTAEKVKEGLNHLFKDLLNKSHAHQIDRRLTLRTRALGGTTCLRIAIQDYCFNTSYLDFENSLINRAGELNKNVTQAYQILGQEGAKVVFKNGLNEHGKIANAVVEIIFETTRPEDMKTRTTTRVVRGTKEAVLNSISQ